MAEVANKLDPESYKDIKEYLQSIAGNGDIRIGLQRLKPTHWGPNNTAIKGHLANFDEPISEEEIRDMYGGGSYLLKISGPGKDGRLVYMTNRTIHIAGDPKMNHGVAEAANDVAPSRAAADPSVQITAMETMSKLTERALDQQAKGGNSDAMQALVTGLQNEMRDLRTMMAAKDEKLLALATAKPDPSRSDELLGQVLAGESARITLLQTQHQSELNALRERLTAEVDRAHAAAESAIARAEDAHKRELQLVQMQYEGRLQAADGAHRSEVDMLKRQLDSETNSLKRELQFLAAQYAKAEAELGTLRAKKDKSPIETMQEIAALKEAMDGVVGGGEEAPKGRFEAIVEGLAPAVEAISTRIAAATASPPPAQVAAPQPMFQQMPDGKIMARKADGTLHEVRQKPKLKSPSGIEIPEIDPSDLALAITFLENAARNETDPERFVQSLGSSVPGAIVLAIRELGVDRFLAEVAKVPAGSVLRATASGRNWIREVGRILVEGSAAA